MSRWFCSSLVFAVLAASRPACAAEPVRHIGIYVEPFYHAAPAPAGTPRVAVGSQFDALLASNRQQDILAARDLIVADPGVVTPMTMMVLAIRLYDVGRRDDAVFWFYVAKDRYIVMAGVLDIDNDLFAQAHEAVGSFVTLAGPIINGYAFCNLAKQAALHAKAIDWIERNPYQVMFMARMPALPGDRRENLKQAVAKARLAIASERAYFADPKNLDAFSAARKANEADAKFCWK